jgi:hypothetical protein
VELHLRIHSLLGTWAGQWRGGAFIWGLRTGACRLPGTCCAAGG